MLVVDFSVIFNGSLNVECIVRPSESKIAAIPVKAQVMTLQPFDLSKWKR